MNILLVSTYELGHQSFSIAHVAALLKENGRTVRCADLSIETFDPQIFADACFVAFSVPMHTAARLTSVLIPKVRQINPGVPLAAFGLYAEINHSRFLELGVQTVLGAEFESALVAALRSVAPGERGTNSAAEAVTGGAQEFVVPDRGGLPALERYAFLQTADGVRKTVGYTETSRGCKYYCRHCPVVPVYKGKFKAIPRQVVHADIRQQVNAGARHITFGDPDFFNGPTHGFRIIEAMNAEFPGLSYDVTVKVEHLLKYSERLADLKNTGCELVTTAVESVDDRILERLDKGHTREDFFKLMRLCRQTGLNISPTFVPFTPWTTLEGYLDLLRAVVELDIVASVSPVQLSIRLLIPPGSFLLQLGEVRAGVGPLDAKNFIYPWKHADASMDELQRSIAELVEKSGCESRHKVFSGIWRLAHEAAGQKNIPLLAETDQEQACARISEPWYCCAEPTENQMDPFG